MRETHQRAIVERGVVGLVLQDFERDFDVSETSQIGALPVVITPDLMLPATLVTGSFGMNTGGLPFAQSAAGTFVAAAVAVAASAAMWLLLRRRS